MEGTESGVGAGDEVIHGSSVRFAGGAGNKSRDDTRSRRCKEAGEEHRWWDYRARATHHWPKIWRLFPTAKQKPNPHSSTLVINVSVKGYSSFSPQIFLCIVPCAPTLVSTVHTCAHTYIHTYFILQEYRRCFLTCFFSSSSPLEAVFLSSKYSSVNSFFVCGHVVFLGIDGL